ncbi:GNAT family N-acetyltransferase [Streptomyces sp. H27-D2]|uniref:GNAT family N-acetyltransferase n=1 Tax=Streptomyces sp. H27-D2 TaxID=3046304 RepID=UPI002DBDD90F|nr:GNAT family N-acetyltransferase [Streptomyces sp. H27-D2]MEC4017938.1 GNAT family N-acetyltransferase [Streptomyces sp. H27-D2]
MNPAPYRIQVLDGSDLSGCHAVCREVFIVEQGISEAEEMDAYDPHAVHLLATAAGGSAPLGTVRFLYGAGSREKYPDAALDHDSTAVIGRLAVSGAARGTGLGVALVRAVEDEARRIGLTEIYLESQTHALRFYERLGYTAFGPEFDEGGGIQHQAMRRSL